MTNILKFPTANVTYAIGTAQCLACQHEWHAEFEYDEGGFYPCEKCGAERAIMKHPYAPDEPHWTCACGNDLHYVLTDFRLLCPNCGMIGPHPELNDDPGAG